MNPAFQRWFGNSKIVDADGNPRIVYHGTDTEFEIFLPQKGERGDGGLFVDTVESPFKFFTADINYAYDVADHKSYNKLVMRCYLRMERPIDLGLPDGRNAFNRLFGSFEKHSKVLALRAKIVDLRSDIESTRRRTPRAATQYDIFDANGKLVGQSTRERSDTPYTYRKREISLQQAQNWQDQAIRAIERKIATIEAGIERTIGKIKQPASAWDPLDAPESAEKVKAAGYDGIIFHENSGETTFAVIDSNQIKSVKNRGEFSDSPNIRETRHSRSRYDLRMDR